MLNEDIQLLYVDLFAGAGGTSTGVETALWSPEVVEYEHPETGEKTISRNKIAKVIACVNHDANAIASHEANHPDALHFTEDVRTLDLTKLIAHVKFMRSLYPNAKVVLWASLECTNFSKAKGGQPRDADSRTLAYSLYRHYDQQSNKYLDGVGYIQAIDPDAIQLENVEEFMSWGEMDENGKPISKCNGTDYMRFVNDVCNLGYHTDYRILNSADFGAYTSRKRLFLQFAKHDLPISWPEPTHCKGGSVGMFNEFKKWKPVKDVLDFKDEGVSIFERKKPLSDKTLERIYAGLIKFVAGGKENFIAKYYSGRPKGKVISTEQPAGTVTTVGNQALVQCSFLSRYNSGNPEHRNTSLDQLCGVVTTNNRFAKVQCSFISKYYSGHPESKNISIEQPSGAITTKDHHSLVNCKFISAYYGNGDNVSSVDSPSPTVTTKDRLSLVNPKFLCSYNYKDEPKDIESPCPTLTTRDRFAVVDAKFIDQQFGKSKPASINCPLGALTANPKYNLVSCNQFIMNQYSGGGQHSDIEKPCSAVTTTPKQNLVTPWIMNTNFGNIGSSIDDPSQTITANRKWHYLMNPQYMSSGCSVDKPSFTLIARMDKAPPYLIQAESGEVAIVIFETDSPQMIKIKEFMCLYGIVDIKMRMLKIPELKMIMGFPKNYKLIGTQAEQKKYIGNAVEVTMARVLCVATANGLRNKSRIAI